MEEKMETEGGNIEPMPEMELTVTQAPPDTPDQCSRHTTALISQVPATDSQLERLTSHQEDMEIRELLCALPTRVDIEVLILWVTETHQQDLQGVHSDVQQLLEQVAEGEAMRLAVEERLTGVEQEQTCQRERLLDLQLQIEDLEDQSHRQNVQIRGLPEVNGPEDLRTIVTVTFHQVLETEAPESTEIDWVHRVSGPRSIDLNRPRNIICRLYRYTYKEDIVRKA